MVVYPFMFFMAKVQKILRFFTQSASAIPNLKDWKRDLPYHGASQNGAAETNAATTEERGESQGTWVETPRWWHQQKSPMERSGEGLKRYEKVMYPQYGILSDI